MTVRKFSIAICADVSETWLLYTVILEAASAQADAILIAPKRIAETIISSASLNFNHRTETYISQSLRLMDFDQQSYLDT